MAYSEQTWNAGRVGNTPVNAARLQHMEDGIAAAVATPAGGTDGQALIKSGSSVVWGTVSGGGGGGVALTDNGDGTFGLSGTAVVDNGNGTYTVTA